MTAGAEWTGSWHMVFVVTATMNILVVALALFVLKPVRRRVMEGSR
jgi:OFA family oxalate/formate antiporter-like MFS transporter